ncbi:MAG TPA: Nif3-like dinuclear metal center hexameric protein, partial [Chitinophagaceae bacterium]|nr:Nif3-like dinuclear metal center hexameric protein [Chitinophagaceae bacterium]
KKLYTFVPAENADKVRQAIFDAGGGHIGNYEECSFNTEGVGTFKGGSNTDPYVGKPGELHRENEIKIEVIFPAWLESRILQGLLNAHPYEEVAFDIVRLENRFSSLGSGIIGELNQPVDEKAFLTFLKEAFKLKIIRHTPLLKKPVSKVAVCGGAGSFLISSALDCGADFFISSDIKYHEFFDANDKMVIADIGHYESEQFTINLLQEFLEQKFPTFAVLKTEVNTNPVQYFL